MDWITTANGLIALITAFCCLLGTAAGAFFAIKNFIKAAKEKSAKEVWAMIMNTADAAMQAAEKTGKSGADKKALVIEMVKASCKANGIEIDAFVDQLDAYIDQCIAFVNGLSK